MNAVEEQLEEKDKNITEKATTISQKDFAINELNNLNDLYFNKITALQEALRKQSIFIDSMANYFFKGYSPEGSLSKDLQEQYVKQRNEIENFLNHKLIKYLGSTENEPFSVR